MRSRSTHRQPFSYEPLIAACLALVASCGSPTSSDERVGRVEITPSSIDLIEGESRTLVARVFDAGGTQIAGGTMFWASRDPGVATVDQNGQVTAVAEGTTEIAASVGGVSGLADIAVERQPASQLDVITEPSTAAQNGVPFPRQPVVQLLDALNRPVALAGVTITASLASGNGTLSGTLSVLTDPAGAATFTNLGITGAAPAQYQLRFAGSGLIDATSDLIALTPGAASRLVLVTPPSSTAQSGEEFTRQPVLQAQDASGNTAAQAGIRVTAAIASGPGTLGGTLSVSTNASGVATFTDLRITGAAGTRTLSFSAPSLTGATSPPIDVTAGTATRLVLATPPSSTASSGTPLATQPVVQLQDGSGNDVAQANLVVTAIVSPPGVTLSGHSVATNASGEAVFTNLTLTGTADTYSLSFDAAGVTPTQSVSVTLGAGSGSQLSMTTQPSASAQVGTSFAQQPVIQLRDGASNPVAQAGVPVTASIATGNGTLGGTVTVNTDASGAATFTDLRITGAVGPHTLTFSAPGYQSATSAIIVITAGPPAQLSMATQPSANAQSGIVFPQQPVVLVQDQDGHPVSGVDVTAAIASGGGTLTGPLTVTSNSSGLATFANLAITGTIGDRTLIFTAVGGTLNVTSGTISLGAGAPTTITIVTQPSLLAPSGVPLLQPPVVEIRDSEGNLVSGVDVIATITPGSPPGTVQNGTATTDASGLATFSGLSITGSGTFTLDFAVESAPSVTVTSNPIVVF